MLGLLGGRLGLDFDEAFVKHVNPLVVHVLLKLCKLDLDSSVGEAAVVCRGPCATVKACAQHDDECGGVAFVLAIDGNERAG